MNDFLVSAVSPRFLSIAAPASGGGAAFGFGGGSSSRLSLTEQFFEWLTVGNEFEDVPAEEREEEREIFHSILRRTKAANINLHDPAEFTDVLELLAEDDDPFFLDDASIMLLNYVEFQCETSRNPAAWAKARDILSDSPLLGDGSIENGSLLAELIKVMDAAAAVDPDQRRAALEGARCISAIAPFLAWIGKGRTLNGSSELQLADISEAASFLGIFAEGVAEAPAHDEDLYLTDLAFVGASAEYPVLVESMWDLPSFSPWWEALLETGIIDPSDTQLRAGSAAPVPGGNPLPLDAIEFIAAVSVTEVLISGRDDDDPSMSMVGMCMVAMLAEALVPDHPSLFEEGNMLAPLRPLALRCLRELVPFGFVEFVDGELVVPQQFHGVVAKGTMMALQILAADDEDDEDDEF